MLSFLRFFAFWLLVPAVLAQDPGWMRYPSISPDGQTIVFTYKGDLYRVPASGGQATPLTIHEAHDFMPVWTKDSKHLIFSSDRFGNFDLFMIPAAGGEARRLTFHSANEFAYDVSPDNQYLLFGAARMDDADNRMYPTNSLPELYRMAIKGGRVEQVLTTPADEAKWSRDGRYILYQDNKGRENPWRKHQRSSVTRNLWIYDTATKKHNQLTRFEGDDRNPVFADNDKTVYYLSEKTGSLNVHKMDVNATADGEAVTQFKTHPVRFLSVSQQGTLCFGYDGAIYTQSGTQAPQKVAISIANDKRLNDQNVIAISGGAGSLAVSPNGKEVAFITRGDVFVTSVDGGLTKRITNTPQQEKEVSFSPDGKTLLYTSERNGKWSIYTSTMARADEPYFFASTLIKETPLIDTAVDNYQPLYSPDGKEIAFIQNNQDLMVYTLATKQMRKLVGIEYIATWRDNDQYFTWSPDGKWLLFDMAVPGIAPSEIGIVAADGKGTIKNLTLSGFSDYRAKWIMDGKAMMWFSNRDGLKSVAQSGDAQSDVFAMFFTQESWDRFNLTKEEAALLKESEEKKAKADTSKKSSKSTPLVIDWNGLNERKTKLTIHSSNLSDALVSKDGENLYYLARFERSYNLWTTNLKTKETKILTNLNVNGGSLVWDKEQKSIYLLAGGSISKIDPSSGKREPISISGEMTVNRLAVLQSQFDQVWNQTNKTFYSGDFHGADWNLLGETYRKHLPHIGNNYEFSELLSEILGELNISHSGSSYGGPNTPGSDATAQLGIFIDYAHRGEGIKIKEVIAGGPLDKAGLNVKAGALIEKIDGVLLTADMDMDAQLNRKADKNVLLSLIEDGKKRDIVVKPITISAQNSLLYRRWVERNRKEVEATSQGQLGYVHIPGMSDEAYRTTFEEILGRYPHHKGIVVDVRFNGGGDLVSDLQMFLSGRKFFEYTSHKRSVGFEPNFRWTKPSVSLVNEASYSDGHCYAYAIQVFKIGQLVGQPVPGTCTYAGWGTIGEGIRWGVPPVGVKGVEGTYLENVQLYPEITIWNAFEEISQGKDAQLIAAIEALLKQVQ